MALTANQQTQMNALKTMLADKELEIRRDYPATFASNGKLFFELFKEVNAQITKVEQA